MTTGEKHAHGVGDPGSDECCSASEGHLVGSEPGSTAAAAGGPVTAVTDPVDSAGVDPVTRAVEMVRDGLDLLREVSWWRLSDTSLLDTAREVERLLRSGLGVQIRLAGEIDERGVAQSRGARNSAFLLHELLTITMSDARARITAAHTTTETDTVTGEAIAARDPEILHAVDQGAASEAHVKVITRCLDKIPDAVDADTRATARHTLIDQATMRDEIGLQKVAAHILEIVDPDGDLTDPPEERAELTIGSKRSDGLTPIRGLLSPLVAEQARIAINALAQPHPIDKHTPDPRPAALRNEQALGEIINRHLTSAAGPKDGGVHPNVVVTITANDLFAALDTAGQPAPFGGAWTDYDGPQAARLARQIACDADIIPQILGSDSAILDQGRAERLFTAEQRRALTSRDRGCAFPGCDIPPAWCQAHHIQWWINGGTTNINNGILLCQRHHTEIHLARWHIHPQPGGGRPHFIPPPHIDPTQQPRQNTHFHHPEHLKPPNPPIRQ